MHFEIHAHLPKTLGVSRPLAQPLSLPWLQDLLQQPGRGNRRALAEDTGVAGRVPVMGRRRLLARGVRQVAGGLRQVATFFLFCEESCGSLVLLVGADVVWMARGQHVARVIADLNKD